MKILLLCITAFALRVAAGILFPGHFWSYTIYYEMATTLVHGGGYCMSPGVSCAYLPPVYPTILAACILTGHAHAAILVVCSLIGSLTVWLTWLTGNRLFGTTAGFIAAGYVTVYPYFVWHDAVVQENATLALVVTGAVYLLLVVQKSENRWLWLATGAVLALTVLTKANLLLFVPCVIVWTAFFSPKRALWVTVGVVLLLGPWLARTWRIAGAPVLYSNGGFGLWTSNHRLTFDYFPERSIDDAHLPEWEDTPEKDRHELEEIEKNDPQELRQAQWYWDRGVAFIKANPGLTARRGLHKILIAFSPRFSPAHPGLFQVVYSVSYLPVLLLAIASAWLTRRRWRELGIIYVLIATFAAGTAVLWAHTSHRMYLEPSLIVLASGVFQSQTRKAQ